MRQAIIRVVEEVFLEQLDFKGGHIVDARVSFEKPGEVELSIIHPDLPEVPRGCHLTTITPVYRTETKVVNIERIEPPKREG